MTKNLPVLLFAKHAAEITEGLLGNLYNPQNTEDVESYWCATVTTSSATVPSGQCYMKHNSASSKTPCSVDANLATQNEDEWTTIIGKQKKNHGSKGLDQGNENKKSIAEMKLQWDSSVVPRIYMIEKEENLRLLLSVNIKTHKMIRKIWKENNNN